MSNKWWRVAAHEYATHVRRKGFLASLVGFPLLMALGFGAIFLFIILGDDPKGLGIVDESGLTAALPETVVITDTLMPDVPVIRFASAEAAASALEAEELDGYVVIGDDYLTTGTLVMMANSSDVPGPVNDALGDYMRQALTTSVASSQLERLEEPLVDVRSRTLASSLEVTSNQGFILFFAPYLFGMFFVISIFASSSYLMTALVEEKENRVMEILVTSVRPFSLMSGKILGLGLLGITQILVWSLSLVVIFFIARANISELEGLGLPWRIMVFAMVMFVPAYLLVAASLSAIGAAVSAVQEGQQIASIVSLLMIAPIWLVGLIIENPNAWWAVALSISPFTSPIVMMQRLAITDVPFWQLALAFAAQALAAWAMIWVASRVLEIGLLRYGKRLQLREIGRALRGNKEQSA